MLLGLIFCAFIGIVASLNFHILTALVCFGIGFLILMFGSSAKKSGSEGKSNLSVYGLNNP